MDRRLAMGTRARCESTIDGEERNSDQVDKQGLGIPHFHRPQPHDRTCMMWLLCGYKLYAFTKAMRPRWCSRPFRRHQVRMLNCSPVVIMHMETEAISSCLMHTCQPLQSNASEPDEQVVLHFTEDRVLRERQRETVVQTKPWFVHYGYSVSALKNCKRKAQRLCLSMSRRRCKCGSRSI